MDAAFRDSSSIVPLCVRQSATPIVQNLGQQFWMVVAWFAPVEVRAGIARLMRTGRIKPQDQSQGLALFDVDRADRREVVPGPAMQQKAEDFMDRFPLCAGDALQPVPHGPGVKGIQAESRLSPVTPSCSMRPGNLDLS